MDKEDMTEKTEETRILEAFKASALPEVFQDPRIEWKETKISYSMMLFKGVENDEYVDLFRQQRGKIEEGLLRVFKKLTTF
ncbi:hypothetical protein HPP92_023507 [Vanilla planifolia]|uniref:Uncharacterized protein n=1 Tax=Vanilla planifolia TaxID=51239 RepID=A0A835PLX1_VANPL|nr:hypothetical protein HPP92_023507 [Vanilla planifolia]